MTDEDAEKAWEAYAHETAFAGDDPYRDFMAGRASVHDNFDSLRSRIAALEADITFALNALHPNGELSVWERVENAQAILSEAPSVVLDQMIREAKAEAWDEGALKGWSLYATALRRIQELNPYRGGTRE